MSAPTSTDTLAALRDEAERDYAGLVARGLSLDLTRGKPSPAQLDLSAELLHLPGAAYRSADGTDLRNYGGPAGLPELREMFSGFLQVPAEQLLAAGNSSLELMHDCLAYAMLQGVPGAEGRWVDAERIAFLCPVPGYDRHFAICERLGIQMVPVPMTPDGPDMDTVERHVRADAGIKGIWCVPKYSNPSGVTYSHEVVSRLAAMPTASADFRIFWDNAYAVHHLTERQVEIADMLAAAAASDNPDRVLVFGSTSKITFAGGGIGFFGSSPSNVRWLLDNMAKRTIGPDKLNQLRHVLFFKDPDGVREHMRRHRELLAPKFEAVQRILREQLGEAGIASWSEPLGGYFVCLDVLDGCAKEVVARAAAAGIALTPAGATHPYADDPRDRTIRIAPTYPGIDELEMAITGLAMCVRLVCYERLLSS